VTPGILTIIAIPIYFVERNSVKKFKKIVDKVVYEKLKNGVLKEEIIELFKKTSFPIDELEDTIEFSKLKLEHHK